MRKAGCSESSSDIASVCSMACTLVVGRGRLAARLRGHCHFLPGPRVHGHEAVGGMAARPWAHVHALSPHLSS